MEEFDSALDLLATLKRLPKLRRVQCDFYKYEKDACLLSSLVDRLLRKGSMRVRTPPRTGLAS